MYFKKQPRGKAGLSLWDPRTAGATMPEPIINHGYFVGTSGLGLWDPRTAGATMPEPRINRAYIAGIVYDAARDDYPHLKNPPGISATQPTMAGLGGVGRGCGCGPVARCDCPRCCAGLPCRCRASMSGLGANELLAQSSASWVQFPNPVLKTGRSAPDLLDPATITDAEIVGFHRNPGQTRVAVRVNRGGFDYRVDPNVLADSVRATIAQGLTTMQGKATPDVIAAERKRVGAAVQESARQDQLDRQWQAAFNQRNTYWELLKKEAKDVGGNVGDVTKNLIPDWVKYVAGVGVALYAGSLLLRFAELRKRDAE